MTQVELRVVTEDDLPVLYEQQLDPDASAMAAFPSRDRDAFMGHWHRILADDTVTARTITVDGRVAGNVVSFEQDGERRVGYWVGKAFWGRGVATGALSRILEEDRTRPLHARVAKHNAASIRVLEKCGFAVTGEAAGSLGEDDDVEELVFVLSG